MGNPAEETSATMVMVSLPLPNWDCTEYLFTGRFDLLRLYPSKLQENHRQVSGCIVRGVSQAEKIVSHDRRGEKMTCRQQRLTTATVEIRVYPECSVCRRACGDAR